MGSWTGSWTGSGAGSGAGGEPSALVAHASTLALAAGSAPGSGKPGRWNPGDYASRVLSRIEAAKRYPDEARALGAAGAAVVRFALGRSGELARVLLLRSSGVAAIDRGALDAVRTAAPFGAPPEDAPTPVWLEVRLRFDLAAGEDIE
jgi:protein TonB